MPVRVQPTAAEQNHDLLQEASEDRRVVAVGVLLRLNRIDHLDELVVTTEAKPLEQVGLLDAHVREDFVEILVLRCRNLCDLLGQGLRLRQVLLRLQLLLLLQEVTESVVLFAGQSTAGASTNAASANAGDASRRMRRCSIVCHSARRT